jgi:hypothetical protein
LAHAGVILCAVNKWGVLGCDEGIIFLTVAHTSFGYGLLVPRNGVARSFISLSLLQRF